MDIAKLVLEYTKALAWPVVVGIVLWWFRKPVMHLVNRLATETESIKGFGAEAKFRSASLKDQADDLKQEAEKLIAATADMSMPAAEDQSHPPLASAVERYLLAEELVLRTLERRWSEPIARSRVVELPNGRIIRFDGILDGARQVIAVEVKLLTSPREVSGDVLARASEDSVALGQHVKKPVLLVIALVAPEETAAYERYTEKLREEAGILPSNIVVEFFFLPRLSRELIEPK